MARGLGGRRAGFSLVELLILVAGALVLAGLTVPVLRGMTLAGNAESAIESMTRIRDFQIRYRERGLSVASDGQPRFGSFTELFRSGLLLEDADHREGGQFVVRHGYVFRMFFVTRDGDLRPDPGDAAVAPSKDGFVVYAWPERYGRSGTSAFAIDPSGFFFRTTVESVLETRNLHHRYSGYSMAPRPFAARATGGDGGAATAPETSPSKVPADSRAVSPYSYVAEYGDVWEPIPLPQR